MVGMQLIRRGFVNISVIVLKIISATVYVAAVTIMAGGTQTEETERLLDTVVWEGFFDSERRYAQKFSVRELLGCLTEKQRYVVAAEIFEDKDDVEIAGMMKISKSAVSRIRTRAIRYLQDILDVRQGKEVPLC